MLVDQAIGYQIVLGIAAALIVAASAVDAWSFRVPNLICLALLLLFPAFVLTAPYEVLWGQHIAVFVATLAVGFALYAKKFTGAGDVKLIASISLWAGPEWIGLFLLVTGIAGGLLALGVAGMTWRRLRAQGNANLAALAKVPVPYGVAIAIGGLCTLAMLTHPVPLSSGV